MSLFEQTCAARSGMMYPAASSAEAIRMQRIKEQDAPVSVVGVKHTMDTTWYDILRREASTAIWLETSPDLNTAKSRIKKIASFWPGRYEVVDHQSQRIVATVATPLGLRAPLKYIGECVRKSFWISCDWLLAPAPRVAGLAAYTHLQKYARDCYRASCEWLFAPMARVR